MVLPFGMDVPSPTDRFHKPLKSEDIGRIYTPLPQCFMHRFHTGAHIASQRYEGTRLNFCNKLKILMIPEVFDIFDKNPPLSFPMSSWLPPNSLLFRPRFLTQSDAHIPISMKKQNAPKSHHMYLPHEP